MPIEDLPRLDAVLISHDHYDHLDTATVDALCTRTQVGRSWCRWASVSHLRRWGVPAGQVVELDWDESPTGSVGSP